ncbi:MAG: BtrH N-terminal domain-containing protein [Anaerolineales bacterium]
MPTLPKYKHFDGRHWETGTVHNYFAYRGVKAPHTGQPYSEAMLMGISGGLLMGYFSFAYKGHDPHVALLTRNTFHPLDTLLTRLGVVQHRQHTSDAKKGVRNLVEALEEGTPAIVWADAFSLPYTGLEPRKDWWAAFPILVFGYDEDADKVSIADRAAVPLTVTTGELAAARARVKKDKFRVLTMDPPDTDKLPVAVQQGIWDCLKYYTEAPIKNAKHNFGLAGFQRWADMLTKPKDKQSWAKVFPAGVKMFAGLTSAYSRFELGAMTAEYDRDLYAGFLEEAALVLGKPTLKQAAEPFRTAAQGWGELGLALLPDDIKPFKQTRELLQRQRKLFVEKGSAGLTEIKKARTHFDRLHDSVEKDFPLSASEVVAFREQLAERVLKVGALEKAAHAILQAAMAEKGSTKKRS